MIVASAFGGWHYLKDYSECRAARANAQHELEDLEARIQTEKLNLKSIGFELREEAFTNTKELTEDLRNQTLWKIWIFRK